MRSPTDIDLLRELEPVAEANVNRHLGIAPEWMPHEYVPWSQGRDFDELPWEPGQSVLPKAAQIAFEVNLLTEDNLPSYHRLIVEGFGREGAWGTWVHRWTAEEARHAIVMRDYLMVTRGADPVTLEQDRMYQMCKGYDKADASALQAMAYVSFQELATRVSHRNTGRVCAEPVAERLLARVAADENLHMIFYRNMVAAALELAPSRMVPIIRDEIVGFQMPGVGIRDFGRKAIKIAVAGVYNLRIHHDDVIAPILRQWRFFDLEGLDAEAEKAREEVAAFLTGLDAAATQQDEKIAKTRARAERRSEALASA
ncbi:putative acyl-(acyl-carrier-protein) desaturase DesA1 [Frankia canadensis]|uniref:Putative acyl-(Acyl-carrier-protein) desaturase DesA1 n=1 Tax=Frankia canadensis TaxID=1836972 RepID=A0A2I2KT56_9ACTN|nr:acyl-ACP desaturase [Frankia canadensis]SNQ48840.1 putative acyl-(acyl-carrier-protein) desaturase DesA1 [Frankia canadensis]SOU56130.1 putative acyl-(acyl-carrier-protein) desaturase DesA1 [Frankia canadensis]